MKLPMLEKYLEENIGSPLFVFGTRDDGKLVDLSDGKRDVFEGIPFAVAEQIMNANNRYMQEMYGILCNFNGKPEFKIDRNKSHWLSEEETGALTLVEVEPHLYGEVLSGLRWEPVFYFKDETGSEFCGSYYSIHEGRAALSAYRNMFLTGGEYSYRK